MRGLLTARGSYWRELIHSNKVPGYSVCFLQWIVFPIHRRSHTCVSASYISRESDSWLLSAQNYAPNNYREETVLHWVIKGPQFTADALTENLVTEYTFNLLYFLHVTGQWPEPCTSLSARTINCIEKSHSASLTWHQHHTSSAGVLHLFLLPLGHISHTHMMQARGPPDSPPLINNNSHRAEHQYAGQLNG